MFLIEIYEFEPYSIKPSSTQRFPDVMCDNIEVVNESPTQIIFENNVPPCSIQKRLLLLKV